MISLDPDFVSGFFLYIDTLLFLLYYIIYIDFLDVIQ